MPDPDIQLVPVLEATDPALVAIAKSLLEGEDIPYLLRGEAVQDLFGWGRVATGYNVLVGVPVFFVREDDAERARELLKDLRDGR
jgi:hypothetical protein